MIHKLLFILFLCTTFFSIKAQQLPLFTQYREHHAYINPASLSWDYFSYQYRMNISLSHRSQWAGIEGAPQTQLIKASYIIKGKSNFSLLTGTHLLRSSTDPINFTGAYGRLAAFFSGNMYEGGFGIGLSYGRVNYAVNATQITFREVEDLVAQTDRSVWFQDVGIGLFFYKQLHGDFTEGDNIYGGFSIPQVLGVDLQFENSFNEGYRIKRIPHYFFQLGYYKYFNEDTFIEPSIWLKYLPNFPVHANMNLRLQYENSAWIGTGYSTNQSLHFEAGVLLGENLGWQNLWRIGYGFDAFIDKINRQGFGNTHELNLSFSID